MGGGAWSFLVGGVICLVNSDNERDLNLLTSAGHLLMVEARRRVLNGGNVVGCSTAGGCLKNGRYKLLKRTVGL